MPAQVIDELIGASRATAARVIGVPERRLAAWGQRRLVVPSTASKIGERTIYTYSLEDLVQGRVVSALVEKGVDIRQIGTVVEAIRSHDHPKPLASLRWAAAGGEVFVELPPDIWFGGRRPDQSVIREVLNLEEIREDARRKLQRPVEFAGEIVRKRGVQGHREVFKGSRVPVETVIRYIQAGRNDREILESFPSLYAGDVNAARTRLAG